MSSSFQRPSFVIGFVAACGCLALAALQLAAADPAQPKKDPTAVEPKKDAAADDSPLGILSRIKKLQEFQPPQDMPEKDAIAQFQKNMHEIISLSDKLLAAKPNDDQRSTALKSKWGAMAGLERSGDESNAEAYHKFVESLAKDKDPEIAQAARGKLLMERLKNLYQEKDEDPAKLLADVKKYADTKTFDTAQFSIVNNALTVYKMAERYADAKELSALLGKMASSSDPQIAEAAAEAKKEADAQLDLIGKPVAIKGTLVDGSPFQISDYKGKVVLVDFWATWCGPCVAEIPNVKKNYETYHDKGFEVIGISLDSSDGKAKLEDFIKDRKIPWHTIFDADPANTQGFDSKLAKQFNIHGIPTVYLLDREGNLVSLNARGEALGKNLEKLLGKTAK